MMAAGCSDPPKWRTEAEIHDIAEDVAEDAAKREVSQLRDEVEELQQKVEKLESSQQEVASRADGVAALVSRNAAVANRNALKDMTRRGACGQDTVVTEGGGFIVINRKCTEADLTD
jgi:5'-deoxynucleotidase YfbR-like HD superfamily hydrolase